MRVSTDYRSKKSEGSDGNSPKRRPPPLNFPMDTTEWARVLFTNLEARIIETQLELEITKSVEFTLNTAISAATEMEILKSCVQKQSQQMHYFKLQFAKLKSDHNALHSKVLRLEDYSRRDNDFFYGISEERNETGEHCQRKIYKLLRSKTDISQHILDNMKIVRCQ